jgi:hypothetical protein
MSCLGPSVVVYVAYGSARSRFRVAAVTMLAPLVATMMAPLVATVLDPPVVAMVLGHPAASRARDNE